MYVNLFFAKLLTKKMQNHLTVFQREDTMDLSTFEEALDGIEDDHKKANLETIVALH